MRNCAVTPTVIPNQRYLKRKGREKVAREFFAPFLLLGLLVKYFRSGGRLTNINKQSRRFYVVINNFISLQAVFFWFYFVSQFNLFQKVFIRRVKDTYTSDMTQYTKSMQVVCWNGATLLAVFSIHAEIGRVSFKIFPRRKIYF